MQRFKAKERFLQSLGRSLQLVNEQYNCQQKVLLADKCHMSQVERWEQRRVSWSWLRLYEKAKKKTRDAMVVFVDDADVIAVCYIRVTKGKLSTKLLFVERNQLAEKYAGKILQDVLGFLGVVAYAFKTQAISIDRPLAILVEEYQYRFGFSPLKVRGKGVSLEIIEMSKPNQFYGELRDGKNQINR